jgi:TPR repeat protein
MQTVALLCTAALLFFASATGALGQMSPERDRGKTSEDVKPAPKVPESAITRYRQGKDLERKGDDRGALAAYEESAHAGYGLAQMRLAEIYDRGTMAV